MNIIENILVKNPCYTAGKTITVKGLMLHSVGCNQPSAKVFLKQWNQVNPPTTVCPQGVIDGNTGDIYQCLPWNHRGWHGGGTSNNTHIGVEMCEPACIKYSKGASFTCSNFVEAKTVAKRTYEAAVELFAYLCKEYNLDPLADGVIISHREGHARGIATGHSDPEHLWNQLDMGYTMDTFRTAVNAAMKSTATPEKEGVMYYVQVGAYKVKGNADAQLKKVKDAGFDTHMIQIDGLYKIQVGAYKVKANANAMLEKVKTAGFNAFVTNKGGTAVPSEPVKKEVKIGCTVKVKKGAKTFNGGSLASFVYDRNHKVKEINVDRVVITYEGIVVAAVRKSDLTIID